MRSPAALISHTVPSASTRPNRCGSLCGGANTGWVAVRGAGRGPGRGPGRGASPETGPCTGGAESLLRCSSVVMRSSPTLCDPSRGTLCCGRRAPAALSGTIRSSRLVRPCRYHQAPQPATTVFKQLGELCAGILATTGQHSFPPAVALVELGRCGSPDFVTSLSVRSPVCRVDNKSIPPSLGPYGDIAWPGTVTVTIGVIGVIGAGGGGSPSRRWISRRCSR